MAQRPGAGPVIADPGAHGKAPQQQGRRGHPPYSAAHCETPHQEHPCHAQIRSALDKHGRVHAVPIYLDTTGQLPLKLQELPRAEKQMEIPPPEADAGNHDPPERLLPAPPGGRPVRIRPAWRRQELRAADTPTRASPPRRQRRLSGWSPRHPVDRPVACPSAYRSSRTRTARLRPGGPKR